MAKINDLLNLPDDLPVPKDNGAADHLTGQALPDIALGATDGTTVSLPNLTGRTVVFIYPRTGQPGRIALVDNWNEIPGARGCTPQTCGYRDLAAEFGAQCCQIFGLSTQTTEYQQELVERLHLPFPILSDSQLKLTRALTLPTFFAAEHELLKRMALVIENGRIIKVFYPVFPPNENAQDVLDWLREYAAKHGA